jgi:hypothetical protein
MKAFGLAVCMAKAGLLLPAAAPARLPCYSSVLADIGDEQSLTANLSTFSGHLKRCELPMALCHYLCSDNVGECYDIDCDGQAAGIC